MKPPHLDAPIEDKAVYLLKEIERLKKIPKYKKIMDIFDAIPEPKRLDYCPMGVPSSDSSKSKEITGLGSFHEEVATKEINKYLKINKGY